MAPKRSIIRVPPQPAAKKAKVSDAVSKKIGIVCGALADDNIEVPCRAMLKIAAPMVMQIPSPMRHAYETNVARMIQDVFNTQQAKFTNQLEETTKVVDQSQATKDSLDSEAVDIQKQLAAKVTEVNSCRDQAYKDLQAKEVAGQVVKTAEKSLADFEEETKIRKQDLEECTIALDIVKMDMTTLPESDRSARVLQVSQKLQGASADQSLQSATPLALQKKPEDRGTFDVMAIQQVEQLLQSHRLALEEAFQGRDDLKAQKEADVTSAKSAMQMATGQCRASKEKLEVAQQAEKDLQAEYKAKEKAAGIQVKELTRVLKQQSLNKKQVDKVNDILSAFNFLLERNVTAESVEEAEVPAQTPAPVATLRYVQAEA